MDRAQSGRLWLALGGGVAVLAVSVALAFVVLHREHAPTAAPPASASGLVVQMAQPGDTKIDPKQPLRCFVNGQFVGLESLADCARKNGVATQALDVGVDQTGALAAADQPGTVLTPLPPAAATADPSLGEVAADHAPVGDCLRYAAGGWREVSAGLSLSACVQSLYQGHCERPGGASYGRWQSQTLRLVPHRVETSSDNKTFQLLVQQADSGCAIADF
jgi:hypothetical protein